MSRCLQLLLLTLCVACVRGPQRIGPFAGGSAWAEAETPRHPRDASVRVEGPLTAEADLLRTSPEGQKLYIQVDLGLKEPVLFLVDTGASISAIHPRLAQELQMEMRAERGLLEGLGGAVNWSSSELPPIGIGKMRIHNVRAAVGVPGVPPTAGAMPLGGILGNNVWSHFVLSIDYKANHLELAHPSVAEIPESAEPMVFDGYHCYAVVQLDAGTAEKSVQDAVMLELDTGSRGILLSGATGATIAELATTGLEPIFGIGAGDNLPASAFLQQTQRVPLRSVHVGGATVRGPEHAQLINYGTSHQIGPPEMPGLVGHAVFDGMKVTFDYPGRRFAMVPSTAEARPSDGHMLLLQQDKKRFGNRADRGRYRARLLLWLEDLEGAQNALGTYLRKHEDDASAQVLMARIHRSLGDIDAADAILRKLDPGQLVEEGELIGKVNSLLLSGKPDEALALASQAVSAQPEDADAYVALADAYRGRQELDEARKAILRANALGENPDGHLLRRARVALEEEDRVGAMAHLRRLVELYPSGGIALWFYTHVVDQPEELRTFEADLERARARLHPQDVPHDFMLSAYGRLGDTNGADALYALGIERDCAALDGTAAEGNCEAWYLAMANKDLDRALELAKTATREKPHRSDYLDTLAVVYWRRGEFEAAESVAKNAAIRNPSDIYLLWQVDRLASTAFPEANTPTP